MTLLEMCRDEVGVMLTVPPQLAALQLKPGGRVRLIDNRDDVTLIDANGLRLALAPTLAAQMLLALYRE